MLFTEALNNLKNLNLATFTVLPLSTKLMPRQKSVDLFGSFFAVRIFSFPFRKEKAHPKILHKQRIWFDWVIIITIYLTICALLIAQFIDNCSSKENVGIEARESTELDES